MYLVYQLVTLDAETNEDPVLPGLTTAWLTFDVSIREVLSI